MAYASVPAESAAFETAAVSAEALASPVHGTGSPPSAGYQYQFPSSACAHAPPSWYAYADSEAAACCCCGGGCACASYKSGCVS